VNFSIFTNLLPDIIQTVQVEFSGATGDQKQAQAIELLNKFMTGAGAPSWAVQGITALAKFLIPLIVERFKKDPAVVAFPLTSTTT
jgi:Mg/Co/Ni transporter MgtE